MCKHDDNFVTSPSGKKICQGCNVREGHEHSCFGEGCECNNATCMSIQGRDPSENPDYKAYIESAGWTG